MKSIMPKMSVRKLSKKCKKIMKSCYCKSNDTRYQDSQEFFKHNKFHFEDVWNLDIQIAAFILPRLYYFRKDVEHGIPSDFIKLDENGKPSNEKEAGKNWNKTLDVMIEAFYRYLFVDVFELNEFETKNNKEIIKQGLSYFTKYFYSLWT